MYVCMDVFMFACLHHVHVCVCVYVCTNDSNAQAAESVTGA
jgi:hypothetical protein